MFWCSPSSQLNHSWFIHLFCNLILYIFYRWPNHLIYTLLLVAHFCIHVHSAVFVCMFTCFPTLFKYPIPTAFSLHIILPYPIHISKNKVGKSMLLYTSFDKHSLHKTQYLFASIYVHFYHFILFLIFNDRDIYLLALFFSIYL